MEPFRLAIAGKIEARRAICSHALKRGIHALPVHEVWIGNRAILEIRDFLEHGNELSRIMKRQRIQQHSVYNGEDGCVRPNAQRQSQNSYERERRRFCQHADSVTEVLWQRFEWIGRHKFFDYKSGPGVSRWLAVSSGGKTPAKSLSTYQLIHR